MKTIKNNNAFTLVELIVVIVILAILATIAFLSFNSQTTNARDSTRLSDINNISKGLGTNQAISGKYPIPDKKIKIMSGTTLIGYQGEAGDTVLNIIKLSTGGGKDPLDKTYYTYTVNITQNKYELLAFMEDKNAFVLDYSPFNETHIANATEYINRYPFQKGDQMGIVLSKTVSTTGVNSGATIYTPIQDISSLQQSLTGFVITDVTINTGMVAVYDNSLTTTGTSIAFFVGFTSPVNPVTPSYSTYCGAPDIQVGYQFWAACNVGAGAIFKGTQSGANDNPISTSINGGKMFQWGENIAWDISSGVSTSNNCLWNRDTQSCSSTTGPLGAWSTVVSDTVNNGANRWNDWSTSDNRGPCLAGYHVPTKTDWETAFANLGSSRNNFASTLKLPMNGDRYFTNGTLFLRGSSAFYWTSTPSNTNAHAMNFTTGTSMSVSNYGRHIGYSVRCVRN